MLKTTTVPMDTILQGDSLVILKTIPSDSVHCCVTSPPYYALRDYGTEERIAAGARQGHDTARQAGSAKLAAFPEKAAQNAPKPPKKAEKEA